MAKKNGEEQFHRLKPFCISLMKERNELALAKLQCEIDSLSFVSSSLLEYILFPLKITLQQCVRSNNLLMEAVVVCMGVVLSKSCVSSEGTLHEILSLMCILVDTRTPPEGSGFGDFCGCGLKSEEAIVCVANTLSKLMLNIADNVLPSLYGHLPALGHSVSVLTNILDKDAYSKSCTVAVIHALISLSHTNSCHWKQLVANESEIVDVGKGSGMHSFTSFLPGIAISLGNLATKGSHKGKNVIMVSTNITELSILGWAHYVSLVMNDRVDEAVPNLGTHSIDNSKLFVPRSKEWCKETDTHLAKLSGRIAGLVKHDSWQVRWSLCVWASAVVKNCYRVLPVTIGPVIEAIVSLSTDEYEGVATAARGSLTLCTEVMECNGGLLSMLEEKLYKLASALPRLMRSTDEDQKLVVLQLLNGYLNILGSNVHHVTSSPEHLSRTVQALAQSIELDATSLLIVDSAKETFLEKNDDVWIPPLSYKHLKKDVAIRKVQSICRIVGQFGQFDCVMDYILTKVMSTNNLRSELLLIMHWILQGVQLDTPLDSMMNGLMQMREDNPTLSDLSACFLLNIFTDCARISQQKFLVHLQQVIILILEGVSSFNGLVSTTALLSARDTAKYLGHKDVADLIMDCADYLIDHVTLSFAHCSSLLSGCRVLKAIIMCGSYSNIALMVDCKEALLMCLDQGYGVKECWNVLLCLAKRLPEWVDIEALPTNKVSTPPVLTPPTEQNTNTSEEHEDIASYFLEYHEMKKKQSEELQDDQYTDDHSSNEATPPMVQCSINVIQYSSHFLSSPDESTRLCVLDCLELALVSLENVDEKKYLPEVHNIWPAFVHRLLDPHLPSRTKAVKVLQTFCTLCGTFLRKRVIEEVWPCLIQTLEELVPVANIDTHRTLQQKLLTAIINEIPKICTKLDVAVTECESIVHCLIPYLSVESVENTCINALCVLAAHVPDLIWLIMIQLVPGEMPTPCSDKLQEIKLPRCSSSQRQVNRILKFINNS